MSEVFLRLDARFPREQLERFLQTLRDFEQAAPNEIHLTTTYVHDDASWKEHLDLLRNISPSLPYETVIKREEMNTAQQAAHDRLLDLIEGARRKSG